jgi:hypothetical protein
LSKPVRARRSKRTILLYDQKTDYAVSEQTIRLIRPRLLENTGLHGPLHCIGEKIEVVLQLQLIARCGEGFYGPFYG